MVAILAIGIVAMLSGGTLAPVGDAEDRAGNAAFDAKHYDDAIAHYSNALLDPTLPAGLRESVLGSRASSFLFSKRYELAVRDCNLVLATDPNSEQAYLLRGNAEYELNQRDAALADFNRALQIDPSDEFALLQRARVYRSTGFYEKASSDYDSALALKPSDSYAMAARGQTHHLLREHAAALADFDRAIAMDPNFAIAYSWRGGEYRYMGQYDLALNDAARAAGADPKGYGNAVAHANALNALYKGDYRTDADIMSPAVAKDGDDFAARMLLAEAEDFLGTYSDALNDLDKALMINTQSVEAQALRGRVEFQLGDYAQTRSDFTQVVALQPGIGYNVLWLHLAQLRLGARDGDEFRANAARLEKTRWPYPIVSLFLGESSEAAVLSQTAAQDPREKSDRLCEAAFFIGEWRLSRGDAAGARSQFSQALAICPAFFLEQPASKAELARSGSGN